MTTDATLPEGTTAPAPAPAAVPPAPLVVTTGTPAPTPDLTPESKTEPVLYNPTGDVGLDMTLKFVGDLGYGPDHPAMAAAINGDFSLLEAELASKGTKGYEAYIKLGQKAYSDISSKTQARQAADKEAIEKIAGGAEQWQAMSTWAAANADDGEKAVLKAQLGKGGLEAQMAASWLATNYNRSNNVSTEGAGSPVSASRGAPAASTGALSAKEYGAEVIKARQAHKGGDFENSPAYRQLAERRMAWRG